MYKERSLFGEVSLDEKKMRVEKMELRKLSVVNIRTARSFLRLFSRHPNERLGFLNIPVEGMVERRGKNPSPEILA